MDEKIELHAIYRKNGSVTIMDQHGREIDGVPATLASLRDDQERILVRLELQAPEYPGWRPHAEITVRVPLEVEERLPEWMREYLADRG